MTALLDTSIFVYTFDHAAPVKRDRARALVEDALASGSAVISTQVLQEFVNVALRRFAKPLTVDDCRSYVETVLLPLCAIGPDESLYRDALALVGRFALHWYDALIVAAARMGHCTELLTEDLQDGMRFGGVTIRNPFA